MLILDFAFLNELKLSNTVKGAIAHIGDHRSSQHKEEILLSFLEEVARRQGNDHLIADQVNICLRQDLPDVPLAALKKLKHFPEVQRVIAQKNSSP